MVILWYYTSLYIQNVCKNKCAVCAMYSVHIAYIAHRAYILYMRLRNTPFYLPSQDQHILRALVK